MNKNQAKVFYFQLSAAETMKKQKKLKQKKNFRLESYTLGLKNS